MVIYAMAGTIFNKNDGVSFAFVYVIASHNFFDNKNKLLMQGKAYTNDFPRFHPPPIPPSNSRTKKEMLFFYFYKKYCILT